MLIALGPWAFSRYSLIKTVCEIYEIISPPAAETDLLDWAGRSKEHFHSDVAGKNPRPQAGKDPVYFIESVVRIIPE